MRLINEYGIYLSEEKHPFLVLKRTLDVGGKWYFTNMHTVVDFFKKHYQADTLAEEYMWLVALDSSMQPTACFEVSHGTSTYSVIRPKEIMVRLLLSGASNFMIVHNHPSGSVKPSKEDKEVTILLKDAGKLMGIPLMEHLIIGTDGFFSFHELGILERTA